MKKLCCPKCNSNEIASVSDKNIAMFVCNTCGYKFVKKRVFISYGHDEYVIFAENLKQQLISQNCDVWFDIDKIKDGGDWEKYIEDGLNWVAEAGKSGIMLFVVTPHSVRRPDGFCLKEMAKAIYKNIQILPVMLIYSELPLSICNLQWYDMQDCIPFYERYNKFMSKTDQLVKIVNKNELQAESMQFSLASILDPIDCSDDIIEKTRKFTGREWLIKKIDDWLAKSSQYDKVFWITGAPGVGKSSVAAWIAENRNQIGAIHFCKYKNEIKNDPVRIVKSIVFQLSTQLPEYSDILMQFRLKEILNNYNDATTLFNKLVVQPLNKITTPNRKIVIIIDALDEASKKGHNEVAAFIANEFDKTPYWLKLFITSRPDAEVILPLQKFSPLTIDTSCEENIEDIQNYLMVALLPILDDIQLRNIDYYVTELAERSEGVFQYVKCICDDLLNKNLKITEIEAFPRSLGSIYFSFFERQFKEIDYYQKNVKDLISAIICAKEPIGTHLLKKIFNINDSAFYNLTVVMGSLLEIQGKAENEVVKIQHLSYIEWLIDDKRSGCYSVNLNDGLQKLCEYGLKEYNKFKQGDTLKLDPHILKWLPSYLADSNNYNELANLLNDRQYLNNKIELGYKDILLHDFGTQLRLAKTQNFIDYHKILINSIYTHNAIFDIFSDNLIKLTKKGDFISLRQATEYTEQLVGKELLIAYISILYSTLIGKKLSEAQKKEIVTDVLSKIEKNIINKFIPINVLDFFPIKFIKEVCYQIEDLDISCNALLLICIIDESLNYYEIFDNSFSGVTTNDAKSFMLTILAIDFYKNNKSEKAKEIIRNLDQSFILIFNKHIKNNTNSVDNEGKIYNLTKTFLHLIRKLFLIFVSSCLFCIVFILFFITKLVFLLIRVNPYNSILLSFHKIGVKNVRFIRLNSISLMNRRNTINQRKLIANEENKELLQDVLKILKQIVANNSKKLNYLTRTHLINYLVDEKRTIPIELLLMNESSRPKFDKLLSLGDVAFVSDYPNKIIKLQKQLAQNINKKWFRNILGQNKWYYFEYFIDWELINPQLAMGYAFDENNLDISYNILSFFVSNYNAIVSANPEHYFPELAGIENFNSTPSIKTTAEEMLKENANKLINGIIQAHFYETMLRNIRQFDIEDVDSIRFDKKEWYWGIIGLLHYHSTCLKNENYGRAKLYLNKALQYIQEYSKDGDKLFIDLFTELYINDDVDAARILLFRNIKNAMLHCNIVLLHYLTANNYDCLEDFVAEIIEKDVAWKSEVAICWLNENKLINISESIVSKMNNCQLKDDLLGYIVYYYINIGKNNKVKSYLSQIVNDEKRDHWLKASAILFARNGHLEMVDYCISKIYFIDEQVLTLCLVSIEFYNKKEISELQILKKYRKEAYQRCLKIEKNKEVKKLALQYIYSHEETDADILVEVFVNLINEDMISPEERNTFLEHFINKQIRAGILENIEDIFNNYSKFVRDAGGVGLLYRHGYFINEGNRIKPVKKKYDVFRNLESLENELFDFTVENISDKDTLFDIAYRYAAYISLVQKGDRQRRIEIMHALNEVIDVGDWKNKVE